MGAEATCTATCNRKSARGKARLETDVLQFRGGDLKLTIPFKTMMSVAAKGGTLRVSFPDGVASFDLGPAAAKWADKILHPPSRLDKLGARPDWQACAINIRDEAFLKELGQRIATLVVGRARKPVDAVFFGAEKESDLAKLVRLRAALKPNGALWIVPSERAAGDFGDGGHACRQSSGPGRRQGRQLLVHPYGREIRHPRRRSSSDGGCIRRQLAGGARAMMNGRP